MKMKIEDYKIPPERRIISVEAIDNKLIIGFEPERYGDFHCDLTDHVEEIPRIGDTAIFWDNEDRTRAIIARLSDENSSDSTDDCPYEAANGVWFQNAIRFRSEDQYQQITGVTYVHR
jgi:hypothetical protein|nr:MAG TPA: hypothetical protein [Caudoviricetes sp.]